MKVLKKDGVEMAVMRPKDPELAIKMAKEAVGLPFKEGQKAMNAILEAQPYTFVGLAADTGKMPTPLLDPDDHEKIVGHVQPGDSMVSWPQIKPFLVPPS